MTEEISREMMRKHGSDELGKRVLFELMRRNPHMVDNLGQDSPIDDPDQGSGYCEPARYV